MRPVAGCPAPWLVLFLVAGFLAGARDHDPLGLHRDRHRAVAGPVLGVDRIVLDRRVEPEPVALVAVVEGALERLLLAPAAAASTAPATPAALRLVVAVAVLVGLGLVGIGLVVLVG